jgi:predicted nucleic acid-binding protein
MALTEAQKRAKAKYNAKATKMLLEFYPADAELLKKVQEQPNKQGYIKELIRKDIR